MCQEDLKPTSNQPPATNWFMRLDLAACGLALLFLLAMVLLAGCQSYQPPGEDLWLTLG